MKVEFYNPEMPDEMEVEIGGLLLVNNGAAIEVSDEQIERFEANTGEKLKDYLLRNQFMTVGGKKGKVHYLTPDGEETTNVKEADLEVADEPMTVNPQPVEEGDN